MQNKLKLARLYLTEIIIRSLISWAENSLG